MVLYNIITQIIFSFTLNGSSGLIGWQGEKLGFRVNYSGCTITRERLETAINKAIDLWNTVPNSRIQLSVDGETRATPSEAIANRASDFPIILCDTSLASTLTTLYNGVAQSSNNIAGVGLGVPRENGKLEINYGWLLLNAEAGKAANLANLNETLLANVIAHEIGHVLGFGHTGEDRGLMYYYLADRKEVTLSQDEIDAMSYLYPRGEIGENKIFGCAPSLIDDRRASASQMTFFWFMIGGITLFGRRKNRNSSKV